MEAIISCYETSIAETVRAALQRVARDWSISDVSPHKIAKFISGNAPSRIPAVVFFGSQNFSGDELLTLEQLCAVDRHTRVIAVSSNCRTDIILKAIRSGAVDYLDLNSNVEDDLRTLLARISSKQEGQSRMGRLITILGPAGGTGASVIATNVAAVLGKREPNSCLLDLQFRGGDLATMLKSNPRHTLSSLSGKSQHLDRTMFDQSLIKHESGIHLLASPEPFADYKQACPQLIQKVVQLARGSYPNVVIDLEDTEHMTQVQMLAQSTHFIIPMRLDFVALNRAAKCIEHLVRAKVSRDNITLVANRAGRASELPTKRVAEVLGLPIEHSIPDAPSTVNASINIGVPLVNEFAKTQAAAAIVRLVDSIMGETPLATTGTRSPLKNLSTRAAAFLSDMVPR